MKRVRWIAALLPPLLLLSMGLLAACTSGDLGYEEIAFVRDGQLWTISPNGANAFAVVSQGEHVVGYGLSPDHQIFVFRTLNSAFARTTAGRTLVVDPQTGLTSD